MSPTALLLVSPAIDASSRSPGIDGTRPGLKAFDAVILGLACLVWFFLGLPSGEFWRTEGMRALVAQAMLDTGDWIVPRLYGEPHFTKPPGFYLAVALCSLPFGEVSLFSARLPSALAASVCVILFAWYFGRRLGRSAGLAAGLILPVSAMWLDKASAAEIDMLQVAWILAAILFALRANEDDQSPAWGWWLASLGCVAGGFLTKWTAPQFYYFTIVPYLVMKGRGRVLVRAPHLVSALLAVLLCTAWIAAAITRTGFDVFTATLLQESLPRFLPTHYERPFSMGEALFHPIKVWIVMLPWSALGVRALMPDFARRLDAKGRDLVLAMHCWTWPSLLFWTFANEHGTRHSFPVLPGVAGFAVLVWYAWESGKLEWRASRWTPGKLLVISCAFSLAVKVLFVTCVVPYRSAERQTSGRAEELRALVPDGEILHHCFWNRNESLFFHYRRPTRRVLTPERLPGIARYALLTETSVREWTDTDTLRVLGRIRDDHGEPAVVVQLLRN